ncbi:hypothetical protein Tco_0432337 [Tanacetum coccineum]
MKDKMVYKGDNVVGALMSVPIFVGTFSVVSDFSVLEDMDGYRDEGMGRWKVRKYEEEMGNGGNPVVSTELWGKPENVLLSR